MDQFGVVSPSLRAIARTPSFAAKAEKRSSRDPTVQQWLGVQIRNIIGMGEQSEHGLAGETGVLVLDVPANSPLAKAGLRSNDVIIALDAKTIDSVSDLRQSAHWSSAGTSFSLTVLRDQQSINLTIAG